MSGATRQWSTLADVRLALERKWRRGLLLCEAIAPAGLFPLRLPIAGPSGTELCERFAEAAAWIKPFRAADQAAPFDVEWTQCNNRLLGTNQLPTALRFETVSDCVKFLGKTRDLDRFARLSTPLLATYPALRPWVLKNTFGLLELAPVFERMLSAMAWMIAHPRPGIYLRQLTIPGVDTKFVESYKATLGEWLDLLLDPAHIDAAHRGAKGFERRYGFRLRPVTVRLRILDPAHFIGGLSDLSVRADEFCKLDLPVETVFVTENDINGLAFPSVKNAVVLFGRGYGFEALAQAGWLAGKRILYWGDIDTHGFAILSQFRGIFPSAVSLLMDRETLLAHRHLWVEETTPTDAALANLTAEEQALYEDIRQNRLGERIRLEQELVDYRLLLRRLDQIGTL
jgi:hypothetical protein